MKLTNSVFLKIIANTPIISFDLIITNKQNQILLGLRKNRPAQGYWFVPGGRVLKDETLEEAFLRITKNELGIAIPLAAENFLGVYQHLYKDNFAGKEGISTHYIVLAVKLILDDATVGIPLSQHSDWKWWEVKDLLDDEEVHPNTKAYFNREQKTKVI